MEKSTVVKLKIVSHLWKRQPTQIQLSQTLKLYQALVHLSYEAIPRAKNNNSSCKYIYIARNPKDAAVSSYKFCEKPWILNRIECTMEILLKVLFIEGKSKHITFHSFVYTY